LSVGTARCAVPARATAGGTSGVNRTIGEYSIGRGCADLPNFTNNIGMHGTCAADGICGCGPVILGVLEDYDD
jgi:hypothetical protein